MLLRCVRPSLLAVLATAALLGCGTHDRGLNTDALSELLSISNLSKLPIRSPDEPSLISGLVVDVDIINVGDVAIDEAFTVTWTLRGQDGSTLGAAVKRLEPVLAPGGRRSITLNITFSPVSDLNGVQDVVTFDLVS